jgi:DNA-binding Lrp family transcriptional regulator
MLRLSQTRFYVVPAVLRTLDILELLYASKSPLKTNEIAEKAGISLSSTYRILRTLVQRGVWRQLVFPVSDNHGSR